MNTTTAQKRRYKFGQPLTPVGAPGVAADPEVRAVLIGTPAIELNGVVKLVWVALAAGLVGVIVHVHTAGVAVQAAVVKQRESI